MTMTTETLLVAADWYSDRGAKEAHYLQALADSESDVNILLDLLQRCGRNGIRSMVRDETNFAYEARRDREVNPQGEFDNAKRWYPDDIENADGITLTVRGPSRTWPYSYMVACRTKRHVRNLLLLFAFGRSGQLPADLEGEGQALKRKVESLTHKMLSRFSSNSQG